MLAARAATAAAAVAPSGSSSSSASRLLLPRAASVVTGGAAASTSPQQRWGRRHAPCFPPPPTVPQPPPSPRRLPSSSSSFVVLGDHTPRVFAALLRRGCRRHRDPSRLFLSTHAEQRHPPATEVDDENDYDHHHLHDDRDQDGEDCGDAGFEYDDDVYSSPPRTNRSRTGGWGGDGYRSFSGGGGKSLDSEAAIRTALLDAPLGDLSRKDVGNSAHRLVRSSLARGDPRGAEDVLRRVVRERNFHLGRLGSEREKGVRAVADEDSDATNEDSSSAAAAAGDAAPSAGEDDDASITYIKPILFHLVMDGWAKCCSDGSASTASADDGSNDVVTPFEAARRAEHVFDLMKGNAGDRDRQPRTAGYNILISAWSRAAGGTVDGDPDARFRAAERAESLLRRMQRNLDSVDDDAAAAAAAAAPDAISYGAAIDAWANFAANAGKHPERDAAGRRAEAMLRDAMERYNEHERRGGAGAGDDLMDDVGNGNYDSSSRSSPPPPPDARCFTGAIRAHSHGTGRHSKSAAVKCEELLRRLVRFRDSISPDSPHYAALAPDPTLFAAVVSAHANRARYDPAGSPRRAEDVFRLMVDLGVGLHHHHDEDNGHRETSTADGASYAFNAVLRAYASASNGDAEAAFRAERLLNETLRDPELDWIVDTVSFNTVLHALSRSRAVGAPERAESILNFMERRSLGLGGGGDGDGEGEGSVFCARPDVTSYSSVINAFARGRCAPGATAAASADDGGTGKPSSDDTVDADALARYRIDKALGIMDRLEGWHRSSDDDDSVHHDDGSTGRCLKPNAVAYTSVINACAYAYPSPPSGGTQRRRQRRASHATGRGEAYETARSILDRCRRANEVDHIVYSTMLVACRNLLPVKSAIRREEVERLVEECKWDGFLSASVVEELARSLKVPSTLGNNDGGDTEEDDDDSMLFDKLLGGYGDRVRFVAGGGSKKKKRNGGGGGGGSGGRKRLDVAVDVRDFPPEWSRHVGRDGRHRRSATGQL